VVAAPHYLLFSGEKHPLRNVSAGYLYQHAELYLHSKGFGAVWLGGVKDKDNVDEPNHIMGIAFGKTSNLVKGKPEEFKRKSLSEIAQGTDRRLEAARLAPSAINSQP